MHGYVELHCHTNYSLLDGASHPEDLLHRAKILGMDSLAVTDHDGLYGVVRFHRAARERGIKPIIGAELALQRPEPFVPGPLLSRSTVPWSFGPGTKGSRHGLTKGPSKGTEAIISCCWPRMGLDTPTSAAW